MSTTPNRNYPQPAGANRLKDDVLVLFAALGMIDIDMQAAFSAIAGKVGAASPVFTGTPTAPTPATSDDSNTLATTAFVNAATALAIANLVGAAPAALDTVYEIAAKLLDEEGALDALMTTVGEKADSADVYLKAAIDTMLSAYATRTGVEELTNKTLTTPVLKLKNSAGAAPTALGELQWDTTTGRLKVGTGSSTKEHAPNNEEFIAEYNLTGLSYVDIPNLGAFKTLILDTTAKPTANAQMLFRLSSNGGTAIDSSANYVMQGFGYDNNGNDVRNRGGATGLFATVRDTYAAFDFGSKITVKNFNKARQLTYFGECWAVDANYQYGYIGSVGGQGSSSTNQCNFIRALTTSGVWTDGSLRITGIRG